MSSVTRLLSNDFKVKILSGLGSIILLGLIKRIIFLSGVPGGVPVPGAGSVSCGRVPVWGGVTVRGT